MKVYCNLTKEQGSLMSRSHGISRGRSAVPKELAERFDFIHHDETEANLQSSGPIPAGQRRLERTASGNCNV